MQKKRTCKGLQHQRGKELEKEAVERKRAEKELEAQRNKFDTIIDSVASGIDIVSYDYKVQFQNKLLLDRFGDLKGKLCYKEYMNRDKPCSDCPMRRAIENNRVERTELIAADGRNYELISTPIKNPDGTMSAVEAVTDITERKRAGEELQKYKFMVESAHDAIFFKDLDSRYVIANAKTLEAFGLSREEVIGKNDYELLIDREEAKRNVKDDQIVFKTGKPKEITKHMTSADGKEYWFEAVKVPQADDKGNIIGLLGIARDITDRKRAEEHIHALSQQLIKVQESERQKLSRDLHDHLAQDLSSLKIGLDTLFDNQSEEAPETRQRVSELSTILQGTITGVRDLAYDLRPPSLDQLGLVQTVSQYCEDFSDKNGVRVDFYSAGMDDLRLDFNTEINLYRLIQEGLNNIRRHADANHVTIRMVASFPNIILRMEDDGKGFDVKDRLITALHEKHMGLRSMEERVSLLQGKMRIQSRPMHGTKVFVEVPYKEKKSGSEEKHIDR